MCQNYFNPFYFLNLTPLFQSQPIGFNKAPEAGKKPARKRPPKKGAQQLQPQTLSIPVESLQNVVQTTTNQLGQQILICTQPGSATNAPVMISYGKGFLKKCFLLSLEPCLH